MLGVQRFAPFLLLGPAARNANHAVLLRDPTGSLQLLHVSKLAGQDYNAPSDLVGVPEASAFGNGPAGLDSAGTWQAHGTRGSPPDALTLPRAASALAGTADARAGCTVNATHRDTATVGGAFLAEWVKGPARWWRETSR